MRYIMQAFYVGGYLIKNKTRAHETQEEQGETEAGTTQTQIEKEQNPSTIAFL